VVHAFLLQCDLQAGDLRIAARERGGRCNEGNGRYADAKEKAHAHGPADYAAAAPIPARVICR